MKHNLDVLSEIVLAAQSGTLGEKPTLDRFKKDFFKSKDPLTEILIRVENGKYFRMDNLDYEDKSYMFVN
jgi:hypothetical protein